MSTICIKNLKKILWSIEINVNANVNHVKWEIVQDVLAKAVLVLTVPVNYGNER